MSRATQVERVIAKGQLVAYVFGQDAVAASQTNVQLPVAIGEGSQAVSGYTMPFEGEIVAIAADLSAAASAGSLTVGATIGGTEAADPTLSITTETSKSDKALRNTAVFSAGDVLGAEITTDGTWDGTSADLSVTVYVLLHLEGV